MKEKPRSTTLAIATPLRPQARKIRHANFRHCFQISAAALLLGSSLSSADDLLRWDVNNTTQSAGTTAVATAVVAGISGSTITGGSGTTAGNSTSPADTWNRTFTATTADFDAAQAAGNYFSFTTTIAPGFTASFTGMTGMILARTSNGPTSAGLFYSTDGGTTYTQTGTTSGTGTGSGTAAAFSSTLSVTPLVVSGGPTGKTVNWRMVVYGGSTGSRLGIIKTDPFNIDVSLTGTSVPDVTPPNLVWTGSGGTDWNTTPGNTNWADTTQANAPVSFNSNDNVTIDIPATIAVDSGGVTAGSLTVSNATGEVSLNGGNITSLTLLKTGAGSLYLGGTNAIAAGITIAGGTLHAESNAALSKPVQINGGALKTDGTNILIARLLGLGAAGSTLETVGSANYSGRMIAIGAAVDTSNSLTKTGTGILTFSNTDTIQALGSQSSKGAAGGMVRLNIADGSVVFTGAGQRNLGGASTWDGPVTLGGGVLRLHGGSISGTGSIAVSANSTISSRLDYGTATVSNPISVATGMVLSVTADNGANALALDSAISGDGSLNKTGNGIVRLGGINTYAGPTNVSAGTLRINGDNSAAAGIITVASGATLGGNGISGGALVMQSGGRLAARIYDWSGAAGIGYDDLSVASFNAASVPMTVTLDSAGLTNFSETSKSFAILNTSGGISNFSPANVTIAVTGFTGTGTWSIAEAAGSLVLSYTAPVTANYATWAIDNGISGEPATGDFDHDGLTNLVEYALGLDPTTSSAPVGTFDGSLLSFTKGIEAKTNGDVIYEIEQSTNLSGWVVVVSNNPVSSDISYTLPSGQAKEFARLKITQLP
jgi:autotransporter-associated beta strand protein